MTTHQALKRRVRDRMALTGERYTEARRIVLERRENRASAADGTGRVWAAEPETTDQTVREATGRGWEEWCDLIEAWPGHEQGHTAVVEHLLATTDVTHWWAQSVTVGWERISGRRMPYQQADGTFAASRSRTVDVDAEALRAMLLDADGRAVLFPGMTTTLRSRPGSKNVRVGMEEGSAEFAITSAGDGRSKVVVAHQRLPAHDVVPVWQSYWEGWLDALSEVTTAPT